MQRLCVYNVTVKLETLALLNFDSKNIDEGNVDEMLVKVLIFVYTVRLLCLVALL